MSDLRIFAGSVFMAAMLVVAVLIPGDGSAEDKAIQMLREKVRALEARLKVPEGAVQASGGSVKLVSSGGLVIQAGGGVDIKGSLVRLNGGTKPVARAGDAATVQGPTGAVVAGSATVLVP